MNDFFSYEQLQYPAFSETGMLFVERDGQTLIVRSTQIKTTTLRYVQNIGKLSCRVFKFSERTCGTYIIICTSASYPETNELKSHAYGCMKE